MINNVILKDCLSFKDETRIALVPNPKRSSMVNHVYAADSKHPTLKLIALFGSNGAGKSNFLKSLELIRAFMLDKDLLHKTNIKKFFNFDQNDSQGASLELTLTFIFKEQVFQYFLCLTEQKDTKYIPNSNVVLQSTQSYIVEEALLVSGLNDDKQKGVFRRRNNFVYSGDYFKKSPYQFKKDIKGHEYSSFISLNHEHNLVDAPIFKDVYEYFKNHIEFVSSTLSIKDMIKELRDNTELKNFVHYLAPRLKTGLKGIKIREYDKPKYLALRGLSTLDPQFNSSLITGEIDYLPSMPPEHSYVLEELDSQGLNKVYELVGEHAKENGRTIELDAAMLSSGTLYAIHLLMALYKVFYSNKTVIIDDIDKHLSHNMVKAIVEFFAKIENTKGQLIITTHDTQLLDERDILRSDEIYFVNKEKGTTTLQNHDSFKQHHTLSRFRGYIEGRFKALAKIGLIN